MGLESWVPMVASPLYSNEYSTLHNTMPIHPINTVHSLLLLERTENITIDINRHMKCGEIGKRYTFCTRLYSTTWLG